MEIEDIKDFWENRAEKYDTSFQATTQDYFMRQLEIRFLKDSISFFSKGMGIKISRIADIGCGNGFSAIELAKNYPEIEFIGYDYSEKMIRSANKLLAESNLTNLKFYVLDIAKDQLSNNFDLIYTDRCLISLPVWDLQKLAIKKICNALVHGGVYIMIENFMEGQNNFNKLRRDFDLDEIKVHDYSLYFSKDKLEDFLNQNFVKMRIKNRIILISIMSLPACCLMQAITVLLQCII